jgi:hypothetical protein
MLFGVTVWRLIVHNFSIFIYRGKGRTYHILFGVTIWRLIVHYF